ncbi:hypothetical protein QOZ80_7AG0557300 [Eleusine coracana subsp. coracana]|nr:hypothetical protein QOZ80_7AG0557300 [Eleusine coracana subsp. coracana]
MFAAASLNSFNAASFVTCGYHYYYEDDETAESDYDLLEEGRRPHRASKRDRGHPLSPSWKIAIRSFVVVATLVVAAFLVSFIARCKSWSHAGPLLVSLFVFVPMTAAMVWAPTTDCFFDLDRCRKRGATST